MRLNASSGFTVAVIVNVSPTNTVFSLSESSIAATFFSTVTLHSAFTLSADSAVIIASPLAIAVTVPFSSTVAIDGSEELHVTVRLNASSGFTVAVIVNVSPTNTVFSLSESSIADALTSFGITLVSSISQSEHVLLSKPSFSYVTSSITSHLPQI